MIVIETEVGEGRGREGESSRQVPALLPAARSGSRRVSSDDRRENFTLHQSAATGVQTTCNRVCRNIVHGVSELTSNNILFLNISVLFDVIPCSLLFRRNLLFPSSGHKSKCSMGKKLCYLHVCTSFLQNADTYLLNYTASHSVTSWN
jgi:hypothetical protein